MDKESNSQSNSGKQMKSLFLQAATYNMLEFIAKKNRKSITQFLDALAIQEYSEYQDKPFKKSVLKK